MAVVPMCVRTRKEAERFRPSTFDRAPGSCCSCKWSSTLDSRIGVEAKFLATRRPPDASIHESFMICGPDPRRSRCTVTRLLRPGAGRCRVHPRAASSAARLAVERCCRLPRPGAPMHGPEKHPLEGRGCVAPAAEPEVGPTEVGPSWARAGPDRGGPELGPRWARPRGARAGPELGPSWARPR